MSQSTRGDGKVENFGTVWKRVIVFPSIGDRNSNHLDSTRERKYDRSISNGLVRPGSVADLPRLPRRSRVTRGLFDPASRRQRRSRGRLLVSPMRGPGRWRLVALRRGLGPVTVVVGQRSCGYADVMGLLEPAPFPSGRVGRSTADPAAVPLAATDAGRVRRSFELLGTGR